MSGTQRHRRRRCGGHGIGIMLRPAVGWAAAAAASAALLAACGGSSSSASTAAGASPTGSSGGSPAAASATPAAQATGGAMGCLTGTWRTDSISFPRLKLTGGAGGTLTISPTGAFMVNYGGIQPMAFSDNGVKGSMQYSGQASGQLRVSGDKLSGVTQSSTFKVKSEINGVSMNLPLPKVVAGTRAPWVGYSCSGNTLTLINPPPGGSWSMTRTG